MSAFFLALAASVLLIFSLTHFETEDNFSGDFTIVKLPNGLIKGRKAFTTTNRPFWSFQKIPFAKPPIGKLRFQAPEEPDNWKGIKETTEMDVVCYQVPSDSPFESEDCLYLNVYTPKRFPEAGNWSLPVMFYIYGGGFVEGTSFKNIYGPEFLLDKNVVVVTINYRVGPFGFLSTQDLVIPGNNGLKDQLFALKWTSKNIHLFGGDPTKITIFGQSAGSASVTYQLLHTKSQGLFRGAISASGSFLCPWAFQRDSRKYAFKTASYIDPKFENKNNSQELLEFLQNASAEDLDKASHQLSLIEDHHNRQILQGFYYAPVIEPEHETAFLTQKMYVQLKKGDFVKVPTLMGFNSEENVFFAYYLDWITHAMGTYDSNLDFLVPNDMRIKDLVKKKEIGRKIKEIYTNGEDLAKDARTSVKFLSDTSYTRPIRKHAEIQSAFSDVYFYQFSYDGKLGNFSFTVDGLGNVTHGEDNKYIWRITNKYYDNSDLSVFPFTDRLTQYRMLTIWTNFAKYLNPTPKKDGLLENIKWPLVGENGQFRYVDILENLKIKNDPKNETYNGWTTIYNSLDYDDFDTY